MKLITIDAWGTLIQYDSNELKKHIVSKILDKLKIFDLTFRFEYVFEKFVETDKYIRDLRIEEGRCISPIKTIEIFLQKLGLDVNTIELIKYEIQNSIIDAVVSYDKYYKPDDLDYVLQKLTNSGFKLIIASNIVFWPSYATRIVIDKLGLSKYFTAQVYADEVGFVKPYPKFYKEILKKIGIEKPEVIIHIGDSIREDLVYSLINNVVGIVFDVKKSIVKDYYVELIPNKIFAVSKFIHVLDVLRKLNLMS